MTIEIASSLIPGQTDTPLDARGRIASLADLATIVNPYVGMRIYTLDTGKSHVVKTLKSKLIGALTVPDAQIDTVEPMPPSDAQKNSTITKAEIEEKLTGVITTHEHPASGGTVITAATTTVPSDADDDALHLEVELSATPDFTDETPVIMYTGTSVTGIEVFTGLAWIPFPSEGLGTPFYGSEVKIPLTGTGYGRYRWYDGTAWSDYRGFVFPSIKI